MKKLMVLPALGVAGAITFGAAAALNVNQNGAVIQVGEDTSLACADIAKVVAWGYDDGTSAVAYAFVDITDSSGDCDGNTLYVTPLDENGDFMFSTTPGQGGTGRIVLGDANDFGAPSGVTRRYQVFFGTNYGPPALVDAESLSSVRLGIDQGPTLPPVQP